jgi:diguanylate cyclase (GGDEF)-like protein
MVARAAAGWTRLGLLGRFALTSFVVIVVIGLTLALTLRDAVTDDEQRLRARAATWLREARLLAPGGELPTAAKVVRRGDQLVLTARLPAPGPGAPPEVSLAFPAEVRHDRAPLIRRGTIVVVLGLVGLYALLVPLVLGASRRLHREAQEREHKSRHDELTGLVNGRGLHEAVSQAVAEGPAAAIRIHLAEFRAVNFGYGPAAGDRVLVEVARRLVAGTQHSTVVARIGGADFVVLLPSADSDAAAGAASRIRAAVQAPVDLEAATLGVRAAIGVCSDPGSPADPDVLLQRAEAASMASLVSGDIEEYRPERDDADFSRLARAEALRLALRHGEIVPAYQPQVGTEDGIVSAVEALARWHHPERGVLGPAEFLSVAEDAGLMTELTDAMLDAALRDCRMWREAGHPLRVAVNLSGADLADSGLARRVAVALDRHDVGPAALTLEVTETAVMVDIGAALASMTELRDSGVRLALDDFGIGHSSLSRLRDLPIDELKLDRSFVAGAIGHPRDAVVLSSAATLARGLGMEIVAEGVEDWETFTAVAGRAVHRVQGWLFGRPIPASELTEWLDGLCAGPGEPARVPLVAV